MKPDIGHSPVVGVDITDPLSRLEFRPDYKGRFDEIVARKPDMVHVETMSSKSVYIGFYWDDGRHCQLWISSDKKLRYHHEDGVDPQTQEPSQGIGE